VNKVEDINAPDDRNIINSFVSVKWGGLEKRTQIFYDSNRPEFNEVAVALKKKLSLFDGLFFVCFILNYKFLFIFV
jgi:hypothetical protein